MKTIAHLLACGLAAALSFPTARADSMAPTVNASLGARTEIIRSIDVEVRNMQNEHLGQIQDMGVDLVNGRIVEVLVVRGRFLGIGGKTLGVPPGAFVPETSGHIYRINMSQDLFDKAPTFDIADWRESGRTRRIAAAYKYFGEEAYFKTLDGPATRKDGRPFRTLGYVERVTKLMEMGVDNPAGVNLGSVWSLNLSIPDGRITSVILLAPGTLAPRSVVPAMALSFSANRHRLVLNDTMAQYSDEPRYVYAQAENGQHAQSTEAAYAGPRTAVDLQQGTTHRDLDQTTLILKRIAESNIRCVDLEVGTFRDRITLRGWVNTASERDRLGAIAIAASRLDLVDNQIRVGSIVGGN